MRYQPVIGLEIRGIIDRFKKYSVLVRMNSAAAKTLVYVQDVRDFRVHFPFKSKVR